MFVLSSSVHIQSLLGNFEPSFGFLSHKHGDFLIIMRFISSSDPIYYSIVYEYLYSSNQQANQTVTQIRNVIAIIKGAEEPDRYCAAILVIKAYIIG
jgi:hypothetical protein